MLDRLQGRLKRKVFLFLARRRLRGRFNTSRVFVLTSSPRSGSTFLSQLLGAIPGMCVLFEPLHLRCVPAAQEAGFGWRTYRPPDADWPSGEAFLKDVFAAEVINDWTARELTYAQVKASDKMLVKFVRANRLLPWMCHHFDLNPILLMRHPCAVVASQMGYGWDDVEQPGAPEFLRAFPAFREVLASTASREEYLAAGWALDLLPCFLEPPPHPWILVTYEELQLEPEATLSRIARRWQVDIDLEHARRLLSKASSVVSTGGISGMAGWQERLSSEQIDAVLKVAHAFGLDFYDQGVTPDFDALSDGTLHARIAAKGRAGNASHAVQESR